MKKFIQCLLLVVLMIATQAPAQQPALLPGEHIELMPDLSPPPRGQIMSMDGMVLADDSDKRFSVRVVPELMTRDLSVLVEYLARSGLLGLAASETTESMWTWINRSHGRQFLLGDVALKDWERLPRPIADGVVFVPWQARHYANVARQIVGDVSTMPRYGLEAQYDTALAPVVETHDMTSIGNIDPDSKIVRRKAGYIRFASGSDVALTLSAHQQTDLEAALGVLVREGKATLAVGIIMSPDGAIRAMAHGGKESSVVPAAICTTYPVRPFARLLSAAWAAEKHLITPEDIPRIMHFEQHLNHLTGKQIFHMYYDLGIFSPTGIDLPGEKVFSQKRFKVADMQITPLQAAAIFTALFNEGSAGRPHFAASVGDKAVRPPVNKLVSKQSAVGVLEALNQQEGFLYGENRCLITSTTAARKGREGDMADAWLVCKANKGDIVIVLLHGAAIGQMDANTLLAEFARDRLKFILAPAEQGQEINRAVPEVKRHRTRTGKGV